MREQAESEIASMQSEFAEEKTQLEKGIAILNQELEAKQKTKEKELESKFKELEKRFNEEKVFLTQRFNEEKRAKLDEIENYKNEYLKRFEFEVEQYFSVKPKLSMEIRDDIVDMVERSFGLKQSMDESTLTDLNYMPRIDAGRKALKHYSIRGAVLVLALCLFLFRGEIKSGVASLMPDANKPSGGDIFVEQIRRQIASKPKYQPEAKLSYQDTYAENVLHYSDYLQNFASEQWQKQRLKDLNEYFYSDLKLSENVVVKFIAEEKVLIKDLLDLKAKINPRFEKEGITRMKKRELESRKKMIDLLGGVENYNKFRDKDKGFF